MKRQAASLCFLFIFCSGVFLGTPAANFRMEHQVCRVNCCKQKAETAAPQQPTADLCQTINRATSALLPTASARLPRAPLFVVLKPFPVFQSPGAVQLKVKIQSFDVTKVVFTKISQSKYIQNQSFLI